MLRGKIIHKGLTNIIIDCGGVGYKVFVTIDTLQKLREDRETILFTHMSVRETALDLYGFSSEEDMKFFEMLLTVSGIGPKTGMSVMGSTSVETLKTGIQSGDATYLTKISGIGKKVAQKIIVELKDKLGAIDFDTNSGKNTNEAMAIDALLSLGYSERESRETVLKIKGKDSPESIIKEALKILSGK